MAVEEVLQVKLCIDGRFIGEGESTYVIAEAGVNHNGRIKIARRLVDSAIRANADAVKFQTFKAERVVTQSAGLADYQKASVSYNSQYEMLKKMELSEKDYENLVKYCRKKGITFLSTPHSEEDVDLLNKLGVPAFKVGSGDLTNIPLLECIAQRGKPMLISTGMATLEEVKEAVGVISEYGVGFALMHCVTSYPTSFSSANLKAMKTLSKIAPIVGYSDHTLGIKVPPLAVALGATIVEKHITLDKDQDGPDHKASLDPDEFGRMVVEVRKVEKALDEGVSYSELDVVKEDKEFAEMVLGSGKKEPLEAEVKIAKVARKSIVAKQDIPKGVVITNEMLAIKRPGTGLQPKYLQKVLGRVCKVDVRVDELIQENMLET